MEKEIIERLEYVKDVLFDLSADNYKKRKVQHKATKIAILMKSIIKKIEESD